MTRPSWRCCLATLKNLLPGLRRLAVDAPFSLWLLDHHMPFDAELLSWPSEAEWLRARRFHLAEHKQRYLATHIALRGLIADRTNLAPSALHFMSSADGKPMLRGRNEPQFSLSYSPALSLIGIGADRAMGVDIEQERPIRDADELADLYFTPAERLTLDHARSERERSLTFLHGWTRKEACLKAMGMGLRHPASSLETQPWHRRAKVTLTSSMRAETASLVEAHHVISWAQILPQLVHVIEAPAYPNG